MSSAFLRHFERLISSINVQKDEKLKQNFPWELIESHNCIVHTSVC